MKLVIVDLDNTVFDTNGWLRKHGVDTNVYPSKLPDNMMNVFNTRAPFEEAKLLTGTAKKLKEIEKDDNSVIMYMTARPDVDEVKDATVKSLRKYGMPEGIVMYSRVSLDGATKMENKGEFIADLFSRDKGYSNFDGILFIDDDPNKEIPGVIECAKNLGVSVEIQIPDQPYNRRDFGPLPENVKLGRFSPHMEKVMAKDSEHSL